MKQNSKSLKVKVLLYLLIFSIAILLFLWFFQVISLNIFYENSLKHEVSKVVKNVKIHYSESNYDEVFNIISHEEDMCIEIYSGSIIRFSSVRCNNMARDMTLMHYKNAFADSNKEEEQYIFKNSRYNTKTLIHALKFEDDNFVFLTVSLEPIDGTINILKSQFVYVALIVFSLSIGAAYLISKWLSKPIESITSSAKKLAQGDFNETFNDKGNINEINELAITLNYARDELAKTEELRREFMANVSHDLKTPLTMIKAYAEMVRDLTYKDKKKRDDNLNVIINETDRLNLLVNDILDFSKLQSEINQLDYMKIDLNELIKGIINSFEIYSIKDGYQIKYEEVPGIIIEADKKRLEQVLYNLITNAINYTGDDKLVIIKVKEEQNRIRVEVIDTGKGIKNEDLKYIWDKYYKSDKTYGRENLGTGIGLSIVKNILVSHKYEYGVITKKNKGTTFYFDIKK